MRSISYLRGSGPLLPRGAPRALRCRRRDAQDGGALACRFRFCRRRFLRSWGPPAARRSAARSPEPLPQRRRCAGVAAAVQTRVAPLGSGTRCPRRRWGAVAEDWALPARYQCKSEEMCAKTYKFCVWILNVSLVFESINCLPPTA